MAFGQLSDLRTAYLPGEPVTVADLPLGTSDVVVRTAEGRVIEASLSGRYVTIQDVPDGTHALEARSVAGVVLAEEFFSVRSLGEAPVMGFVTSFDDESRESVLAWLRQLRCTVVQVYDWMDSYSAPMPRSERYEDPLGRPVDRSALVALIAGIREQGAVAQAYAPVCAADEAFAGAHDEWLLRRNDGAPESLGNLLQIMDPANREWQRHWIEAYGRALDELGFDGLHLDTYGYPRCALDSQGATSLLEHGYDEFVRAVRAARPSDVISFNQVNGVPRGFSAPERPGFRYVEVWPPNDKWRHLEGLLQRSADDQTTEATLSIYPPVWAAERTEALRTAVLTEAITTMLGAGLLIWGDDHGVLKHPYYVEHEQLRDEEIHVVLNWHRFALRCRDLFKDGVDTTWYELDDENAAASVVWEGSTSPEPNGGSLFTRVRRLDDIVVIAVLDLTGSVDGSWQTATSPGRCGGANVSVLVDSPEKWGAMAAVLGADEGRFKTLTTEVVSHREGWALSCSVPLVDGWSVVRFERGV